MVVFVSCVRGTGSKPIIVTHKTRARHSLWLCRNYSINQRQLFDENYGLASTQSLKNKDIPEGGAKGTILPSLGAQPVVCVEKYVDVRYAYLSRLTIEGVTYV